MKPIITVIITRSSIGGAQKYVLSMVEELNEQYQFHIIVGSAGYLSEALEKKHIKISILPSLNSLNFIKATYQLHSLLSKHNTQLINTHSTLASIYARCANWRLNTPLIYSVHGWFFTKNTSAVRQRIGPVIERLLTSSTTHWITETKFDQSLGLSSGAISNKKNSTVIPNAIPTPIQNHSKVYIESHKTINIAFIGRISFQKNPVLAIQIMNELPNNFTLTLFCDDKNNENINRFMNQYGLNERINLIDNEKETANILHQFDLLLVTSRYEGMPLCVIEAMASGLPIVSPNICGINELISNGENGYLVDDIQTKTFAQKIKKIFESEQTRQSMSKKSLSLFKQNHTLTVMSKRLSSTFEKIRLT